jgi:hypothetical protein
MCLIVVDRDVFIDLNGRHKFTLSVSLTRLRLTRVRLE